MRQCALSLIFISSDFTLETKMLTAMLLIFVCLILQAYHKPFISTKMNEMEAFSLCSSNFTLFAGFMLSYPISENIKNILTVLLMLVNLWFIISFLRNIFWIYISHHIKLINKICPCFGSFYSLLSYCKLIYLNMCKI